MTVEYIAKGTNGSLIIKPNNSLSGVHGNDVYVKAVSSQRNDIVYASVTGVKNIREFLYNFAVIGGLIKEGERLVLDEPSGKDVPADGVYRLDGAHESRTIAVVQGGRVLIPQAETGEIADFTDSYLSKYSGWELTRLEKVNAYD